MARPRAISDDELLSKAMPVFWRSGYVNTGMRELEQELDLKAPSLYNRFGSKDALFRAVLERYLRTVVEPRIEHYLRTGAPLPGLRKFFDSTYEYATDRRPPLSCLLVNTSLEFDRVDASAKALLARGGRMIRKAFRQTLTRAQREGALQPDANLGALADALYLGLQGLLVHSKVERDKATLKRMTNALFASLPLTAAA